MSANRAEYPHHQCVACAAGPAVGIFPWLRDYVREVAPSPRAVAAARLDIDWGATPQIREAAAAILAAPPLGTLSEWLNQQVCLLLRSSPNERSSPPPQRTHRHRHPRLCKLAPLKVNPKMRSCMLLRKKEKETSRNSPV